MNKSFIDLFAGIGGFRIALEEFGATCVFSSEIDKYACETYQANFKDRPDGDIKLISSTDIPKHDILCGGFPCQPFSVSGKQKGFYDSRGTLFFEIARIVEYHMPKLLFLENVANLKRHSDGETFEKMISILDYLGYDVYHEILNASDYGVPQARKRIYIVAFRKNLMVKGFTFPKPTFEDVALEDVLIKEPVPHCYFIEKDNIILKEVKSYERQLKPIRVGTINKGGQGDRIYHPKGHAITLSAEGGGSGAKTGAYLIDGKIRKLTPTECSYLQGFPSSFKIPVKDNQAWKQFGNSVSIPVLRLILKEIRKQTNLV